MSWSCRSACLAVALVALGLSAGPASTRPCDASVVGLWTLVHIEADEPGVEELYARAPYEYTTIRPDSSMMYFATNRAISDPDEILQRLDQADRNDDGSYDVRLGPPNYLAIFRDGQPFQIFICDLAETDDGLVQAGDMVLTNLPGSPHLFRIERRLD